MVPPIPGNILTLLKSQQELLDTLAFNHEQLSATTRQIWHEVHVATGEWSPEQADWTGEVSLQNIANKSEEQSRSSQLSSSLLNDTVQAEHQLERTKSASVLEYAERVDVGTFGRDNVNHKSMVNLMDVDEPDHPWWVADPHDLSSVVWGYVIAVCVVYICWLVPFSIGFNWWRAHKIHYYLHYLLEALFWFDMLQSFRTAFISHGKIKANPKDIAKHYFHLWFWVDLLANVPWESIAEEIVKDKTHRKSFKIMKWAKLPKLLRLARCRKVLDGMGGKGQYTPIFTAFCCFVFLAHMSCCTLIGLLGHCEEYPPQGLLWKYSSDVDDRLVLADTSLGWHCTQETIPLMYFEALHVSTAMVLGNHLPQHGPLGRVLGSSKSSSMGYEGNTLFSNTCIFLLATASEIAGVIMSGVLFAKIARLIIVKNWRETCLWMQWDSAETELERYGDRIPLALQTRIRKYFEFRFRRADYGQPQLLDSEVMTFGTRVDVAFSLYGGVLRQIPCFYFSGLTVLSDVCRALSGNCYMKTEYIYRLGEAPVGLYILNSGSVELQDHTGDKLRVLHNTELFGETVSLAQLISERRGAACRKADCMYFYTVDVAQAQTDCFILHLAMAHLREICSKHKRFLDVLIERNRSHTGESQRVSLDQGPITDKAPALELCEPYGLEPSMSPGITHRVDEAGLLISTV